MQLADFDYHLPEQLIAQFPPEKRGDSRLLLLPASASQPIDSHFRQLPEHLQPGDLLVLNDTRVIKARLHGHKESGGAVEGLVERVLSEFEALAQLRVSKPPQVGSRLLFNGGFVASMQGRQGEFFLLRFERPVMDVLEQVGELPLPPYISHQADEADGERYQTVYAKVSGAVAAPTAGLHFTDDMLQQLAARDIAHCKLTLHVGAGTFQPVRVDDLSQHKMHHERYRIPEGTVAAIHAAKAAGRRIVAVGTTSMRALESACLRGEFSDTEGDTNIFITPGFQFKCVDALITNFHLPRSTLMMLVSAFAGHQRIMAAYRHAVEQHYRFFSYGDAMLLERFRSE